MNWSSLIPWRKKAAPRSLSSVSGRGGWYPLVHESYPGAWQQNVVVDRDTVLSNGAVYACVARISADVSKLRVKLVRRSSDGLWSEVSEGSPFLKVLSKPNRFQTRIKFFETWVTSKLIHGNFYALKQRDARGVVIGLYPLEPSRVQVLVSESGDIYYRLQQDNLTGVDLNGVTVPSSEIIHDTCVCLYHPLMGVSPLTACGVAATQGNRIQQNSAALFGNYSAPGGLLTAPGAISDETAARLKEIWALNFTGNNSGKTAVLGDGLKFESMTINPIDAQLIEQLKWTVEDIARVFQMPQYKLGAGPQPTHSNIESLQLQYYADTLQSLIEQIELLLDEGLSLPSDMGTEFDTAALMRMDTVSRFQSHSDAVGGGWMSPNEARAMEDLAPVEGGDTPYLQQQNYSLAALSRRDTPDGSPRAESKGARTKSHVDAEMSRVDAEMKSSNLRVDGALSRIERIESWCLQLRNV